MKTKLYILVIILCFAIVNSSSAQNIINKIPNQEFIGARPMALGETFVAIADDINAIYWNPAGLPALNHLGVNSMHSNLFQSGVGLNYLSFAIPGPGKTGIGVDWMNIGFGDEELEFGKNKINFSFGHQLFDKLAYGFNVKYIQMNASLDKTSQGSFKGWGLDWGLLYSPVQRLKLGLVFQDVTNTKLHGIEKPIYHRNLRIGAAYELFDNLLIAMDLDDRFHLGCEWLPFNKFLALRGGLQQDFYTNEPLTLSFGFGLDIPIWGQRIRFDYAFTDTPTLLNTQRSSLSILIDLFPRLVKIKKVKIKPVYASLYKYYEANPIGQVDIEYNGKKDLDCTIHVDVNKYGNEYVKNIVLPAHPSPENIQQINLIPAFNDSILAEHDDIPLVADIKISYTSGNRPREESVSEKFTLHRRNRIDWQYGTDQAAAFVTPEDPVVVQFNRNALRDEQMLTQALIINEAITKAIGLFSAVTASGIRYEEDPYSPYRLTYQSIDNILYPAQLLSQKRGDCDDLCVLFASLFENRNIPTALVSVPGHIFLLFNSGISPQHSYQLCCADELYLEYQNQLWIPLETTWLNWSFSAAWSEGANQLKQHSENSEIIEVRDAWQQYKPIADAGKSIKSFQKFPGQNLAQQMDSIRAMQQNYLKGLEKKLSQFSENDRLRNELAIKYAHNNQLDKAELHFNYLLAQDSTNYFALNNLGNLNFLKGNLDSARTFYEKALDFVDSKNDSDGIYLNLGLLYAAADLDSEAVDMFAYVIGDSDNYQRIGDMLGITIQEDELLRAAGLTPRKKVSQATVKQLIDKARKKKKKEIRTKKTQGVKDSTKNEKVKKKIRAKGYIPTNEIEIIFYWAH